MNNQASQREPELNELSGERGIPSVNDHGQSTVMRGLVTVFLLLILGAALALGYWKYQKYVAQNDQAATKKDMPANSVPTRTFLDPPEKNSTSTVPALPGTGTTTQPVTPVAVPQPQTVNQSAYQAENVPPPPVLDKSRSPMMTTNTRPSNATVVGKGAVGTQQPEAPGEMASLLTATRTNPSSAGTLGNRNFILAKGAFINCALKTRLDSTVPGMTSCVLTRNIYSDNGKVLLFERGSEATGEYQANMRQGMARIFVLWNRIKTPNGIVIALDSLGTDQLGGAGLPGYVDNHFWERFGGALMLTLVDDVAKGASTYLGNMSNQGGQNYNIGGGGGPVQNVATEALKNTINIPPTLYKNQGEEIGIFVARDLDFSSVYDVSAIK